MSLTMTSGPKRSRSRQGLRHRGRQRDFGLTVREDAIDELTGVRLVVQHEHPESAQGPLLAQLLGLIPLGRPCLRGAGCSGCTTMIGSDTLKVAPWPSPGLLARTVPPCSSTSCLTIASPRPSPPCRRVVLESACRKRSKTWGRNSGLIPMPVSMTLTSTCELTRSRSTWTRPPLGVNFTALESRFQTTCWRARVAGDGTGERVEDLVDPDLLRVGGRHHGGDRRVDDLPDVDRRTSSRNWPETIREMSSRSSMIWACAVELRSIAASPSSTSPSATRPERRILDQPRIAFSGVRSSWLRIARNSSFIRLASSATSRAAASAASDSFRSVTSRVEPATASTAPVGADHGDEDVLVMAGAQVAREGSLVPHRRPTVDDLADLPLQAGRQVVGIIQVEEILADGLFEGLLPEIEDRPIDVGEPAGEVERVDEIGGVRQGRVEDPACASVRAACRSRSSRRTDSRRMRASSRFVRTRAQLPGAEGFHEVVIRPGIQPLDARLVARPRREHDDGDVCVSSAPIAGPTAG